MGNTALPRVGDDQLQRLTALIEQAIQALEANPFAGLRILPPVVIGASDTRVYHGLGYPLRYYFIVSTPIDIRLAVGAVPETIDPANYFTLRASTPGQVTLAVV
jgi:hypothetical protein